MTQPRLIEKLEDRRMFSADAIHVPVTPTTQDHSPQLTAPSREPIAGKEIFYRYKPHATVG